MNLKVRLASMMILLLMAVMAVQYLLAEREHRALVSRLADLTSGVDRSTREFSERANSVFHTGEGIDSLMVIVQKAETRDGRTILEYFEDYDHVVNGDTVIIETDLHRIEADTVNHRPFRGDEAMRAFLNRRQAMLPDSCATVVNQTFEVRHTQADSGMFAIQSFWTDDPNAPVEDLAITLPVPLGDNGFLLRMSYPLDAITGELDAARKRGFVWLSLLLGVGVLGATLVAFQFTRPITSLQQSFRRVEEGDLDVRVTPQRHDEIGQLTESFNEMVERLDKTRLIETRLAEAEKMATVGSLAAGVAHEVRNPLNAILLTLEQMRDKVAPTQDDPHRQEFDRYLGNVSGEVTRLEKLVTTFLDLSSTRELDRVPIDLMISLKTSLQLFQSQADAQGVALDLEGDEPAPPISGDNSRLATVWNNLLSNALEATPSGGRVRMIVSGSQETVSVQVTDTGLGIHPDNLDRIWEPFYTGQASGTGLGLSIVRSVVEGHGGRVEAQSQHGSGTSVTVWLPKSEINLDA